MAEGEDEFAIIARCFAPLADDPAAQGLMDDVALWTPPPGPLVLTTDAIVEGVHFLPHDPIETIAQKALRVNLSDLAAKAARPLGYLLTLAWPHARPAREIEGFAAGLRADQALFGLKLLGGDTVATPGPLMVSITILGASGRAPPRSAAQVGDDLWVTGTIGDGWLGLLAAQGQLTAADADRAYLIERYRRPTPRLDAAALIAGAANAAMDVSDGLIADAAKLAAASGVRLTLALDAMPVSAAAAAWLAGQPDAAHARAQLAAGGDDYEVLFTAPAERRAQVAAAGLAARIGRADAGTGLALSHNGAPVQAPAAGFTHKLGR